jgi:hypothetical protein
MNKNKPIKDNSSYKILTTTTLNRIRITTQAIKPISNSIISCHLDIMDLNLAG